MAAATALIRHAKEILQILQQGGTLLRLRAQKERSYNYRALPRLQNKTR